VPSGAKAGKLGRGDDAFDPASYATVAERISLFYESFPRGRIVTELVSRTERDVVFRALVYRQAGDPGPAATGWAAEREGDGEVNAVACLENTETSAIGRALANLGFTAARERPSAEEMAKARRARNRLAFDDTQPEKPAPARQNAAAGTARYVLAEDPQQRAANAVHDLLRAIEAARTAGLRSNRAARWREFLLTTEVPADRVGVWEQRLRAWTRVSLRAVSRSRSV